MRRRCVLCGCQKFAIIINIEIAEILHSFIAADFFDFRGRHRTFAAIAVVDMAEAVAVRFFVRAYRYSA